MKFVSFEKDGYVSFGAIKNGGIVDLGAKHGGLRDLRDAIRADKLGELIAETNDADENYGLADVELKYPSVFMRSRESLVGHERDILDPPESDQLDYEGEIVIVIGKEGRRISEANAHEYIAGLTVMNEGSLRDFLRHAKFNVTQGKNFAKSGSLGPWMVTPDELDPMGELQIITTVNGEERQNDTTANIIFPFRYLISYLSTFYHLKPGDIIATGTPNGAGARFDPPKYLRDGDIVEVEVPGIGKLSNRIVAENP